MNCCVECFQDEQIREMIITNDSVGNCDFCDGRDVKIYSVDTSSDLTDLISEIMNVYIEDAKGELLFDILINDWNIFNRECDRIQNLLYRICNTILGDSTREHNIRVKIPDDYIQDFGIFSGRSWNEFSEVIKTKNRFYNSYFKMDQFASFLSYSIKRYLKGSVFFRARIWNGGRGYEVNEMGAPPFLKRKAGRVNPEGIGVLYLTSDEKTALSEVRASAFDYVSVGEFRLKKDINVVNISGLKNISPVLYAGGVESLASNIKVFSDIAKEIGKPLRKNDSVLEYLPTQYITEFIKSQNYSGVEFVSTMGTGGNNIAVFDENLFECVSVYDVEIKKIEYLYDKIINQGILL